MGQVLLYAPALPTRLAVESALGGAAMETVPAASPTDLLDKLKERPWDIVILDGDSSPIPLPKLLAAVSPRAASAGAALLALTSAQSQTEGLARQAFVYDRPIRRAYLLGALNRLLIARGKKPAVPASEIRDQQRRRALRIPLLVPVAYRLAVPQAAWATAEALDVSATGARLAAASGVRPGQALEVRNLLTEEEASFHAVWLGDDLDEMNVGFRADRENLRFWRVA